MYMIFTNPSKAHLFCKFEQIFSFTNMYLLLAAPVFFNLMRWPAFVSAEASILKKKTRCRKASAICRTVLLLKLVASISISRKRTGNSKNGRKMDKVENENNIVFRRETGALTWKKSSISLHRKLGQHLY